MRHGRVLWGMLLLGAACAPETRSAEPLAQSAPLVEEGGCLGRVEDDCELDGEGRCPASGPGRVCRIWITAGALPVKPATSCITRGQWLVFHLADGVPESILSFGNRTDDYLFEGYPSTKIELGSSAGRQWCGRVRKDAKVEDHWFRVSSGLPEGQPGELEVVRDPNEDE
ncbi:hypothetical protein LZ198_00920 [Myxococcus sp. K15C18031901]|uniref:hypothetical protein n=1 Tax=Myxococcus dinghuensis TaxID=2906761 RepID=UPI0020A7C390|nr:hypothetical protein [Myxococcus dinghuensis]MCP3097428.1 hypothetical protein [Myxococcus dinghuensis]